MLGLISSAVVDGRKCKVESVTENPLGLRCANLSISVGAKAGARRVERCLDESAALLRSLRVRELVFAEGFPFRDKLLDRGFREAGCEAVLEAKAGEIVAGAAKEHRRVLLSTPRADRRSMETARELSRRFRRLLLDAPEPAFGAISRVCGEYGVSPEPMGSGRFADVDGAVFFAPPPLPVYASARCAALLPEGGRRMLLGGREIIRISFVLPEKYAFSLPFPAAPILSAAVACGRIDPGEIAVASAGVV